MGQPSDGSEDVIETFHLYARAIRSGHTKPTKLLLLLQTLDPKLLPLPLRWKYHYYVAQLLKQGGRPDEALDHLTQAQAQLMRLPSLSREDREEGVVFYIFTIELCEKYLYNLPFSAATGKMLMDNTTSLGSACRLLELLGELEFALDIAKVIKMLQDPQPYIRLCLKLGIPPEPEVEAEDQPS